MKRRRSSVFVIVLASGAALVASTWLSAQHQPGTGSVPVETIAAGQRVAPLDPADRGATYYWLESQASRTRTTFADAEAITERGPDGDFSARLRDLQGNELARFTVDRTDASGGLLVYQPTQGSILRANARAGLRTPLDWSNEQAYSLWKDAGRPAAAPLEWQGDVIRPAGADRRDLKREIIQLRTEWNGGITARAVRKRQPRQSPGTAATVDGEVVVTTFAKDDIVVGTTVWDPEKQLFVWRFPGLSEGSVEGSELGAAGEWPFAPDLAWTTIQAYAFYQFHSQVNERGQLARATPGWSDALIGWIMPTLSANEPGCDGLHWLDGTIFRRCCDSHDRCYQKRGCTASTWWTIWTSWQCDACNLAAVGCFATGGHGPYYQYPWLYWY